MTILQIVKVTWFQALFLFSQGTTADEVNLKHSAVQSLASLSPKEEASEFCGSKDVTNNTDCDRTPCNLVLTYFATHRYIPGLEGIFGIAIRYGLEVSEFEPRWR